MNGAKTERFSLANVPFPDGRALPDAGSQPLNINVLKSRLTIYVQCLKNLMGRQTFENTPKILFARNVIRGG